MNTTTIASSRQSIFDIAISAGMPLDNIFGLVVGGNLQNIDQEIISGTVFTYTPVSVASPEIQKTSIAIAANYAASDGQTLFDVAIMTYGGMDNFFKLLTDSNFDSPNTHVVSGDEFIFAPSLISDNFFFSDLRQKNIVINTGNIFSTPPSTMAFRITEDFFFRITEDGNFRIME